MLSQPPSCNVDAYGRMGLSNFAFLLHLNIAWDGEGGEGSLSFSGSFLTCKDIICVCVFMLNIYGAHVWASDCVCWDASVHHMPQKAHLNTDCKTLVFYFPALERKPGPENNSPHPCKRYYHADSVNAAWIILAPVVAGTRGGGMGCVGACVRMSISLGFL